MAHWVVVELLAVDSYSPNSSSPSNSTSFSSLLDKLLIVVVVGSVRKTMPPIGWKAGLPRSESLFTGGIMRLRSASTMAECYWIITLIIGKLIPTTTFCIKYLKSHCIWFAPRISCLLLCQNSFSLAIAQKSCPKLPMLLWINLASLKDCLLSGREEELKEEREFRI